MGDFISLFCIFAGSIIIAVVVGLGLARAVKNRLPPQE